MATGTVHADEWRGEDVSIGEVERQLCALRSASNDDHPELRTSVMTHTAWVPRVWLDAARGALAGLAERHPSRTILLVPEPDAHRDAIDAIVSLQCFPVDAEGRQVCTEVIELSLHGARAKAPASIVQPLLVADLPVFSRWRGRPPFGTPEFEQMVGVVDRLIVDSSEWPDLPQSLSEFSRCVELTAVSDIAWRRSLGWRASIASMWPGVAEAESLRVVGPQADALLLSGWMRARLRRNITLEHEAADEIEHVEIEGESVSVPRGERPDPSDLLSAELDQFGRDRIYEEAVSAAASG
jgi:Glucose-6-phosphate dehydrogenase subunit